MLLLIFIITHSSQLVKKHSFTRMAVTFRGIKDLVILTTQKNCMTLYVIWMFPDLQKPQVS
jgi:hypothetical protein